MRNESIKINKNILEAELEEVGFESEKFGDLDDLFLDLIDKKKLQAAGYMVAKNNKIIACKSMGKLTYKEDSPDYMPDSIRRIASVTKMFTAIAIMQLIEKGKLTLYQQVSTILKEFDTAMHRDIKIFHLLTHTSGIAPDGGYFLEPYPANWWDNNSEGGWIKQVLSGPTLCKPGEKCNYCTAGFMLLGEIISKVSGLSYEKYIMKNIINAIGMENTFFDVPEELKSKVCFTHEWDENRLYIEEDNTGRPPRSGSGLYSNLHDLLKLGQTLLNNGTFNGKRILSRKSVELMTTNRLKDVPYYCWGSQIKDCKMGLGVELMNTQSLLCSPESYGHEGSGRCILHIDPVEQFIVVYFVPTNLEWLPESISNPMNIIWSGII